MRATLVRLTLPTVIALTTAALGWWSVPIVGGIWGLLRLSERPVAVAGTLCRSFFARQSHVCTWPSEVVRSVAPSGLKQAA